MEPMTKLERFRAFTNFQPVDRVPRNAGYIQEERERIKEHIGRDPAEAFDTDGGAGVGLRPPEGYVAPDYTAYHPDREHGKDGFIIDGNGCGHLNHGFHHFTEYISPLRNAERFEEIENYPFVSRDGWLDDHMAARVEEVHAAGDFVFAWTGHMYESSWQVRGYEEFLMDLLTQRDWAEYILDRYHEINMAEAVAGARAGADMLRTGDDVANQNALMFQPELWREVFKPRWAKVYAAAKEINPDIKIWYHSDGNIWDILDDMVEIGLDILNPVQPECMDPLEIRKRYGDTLSFDGCIGTQTTFPFGTPEEMKKTVHACVRDLDGKNGGLKLAPTHVLEPDVPPENVVAFFEACDEA